MANEKTSWGKVANWYDDYLVDQDNYQAQVIKPNIERLLKSSKRDEISLLDMACGQGYFSFVASDLGINVIGLDIAKELVEVANNKLKSRPKNSNSGDLKFLVAPSHDMGIVEDKSVDICICVLALQNIKDLDGTFKEVSRVLKNKGKFIFVLNHPSFRVPQYSDWQFDSEKNIQSRLVSKYMIESTIKIDMTPSKKNSKEKIYTLSFHRPLQVFVKALANNGFFVSRIEEWCSHKKSESGPRKKAEDDARKEIPMFMAIEAVLQ